MRLLARALATLLLVIACAATAGAQADDPASARTSGDLLEVKPHAYGPDVNSDQYGRPHVYRSEDGQQLPGAFTDDVRRNAYGLGVHADEFGRPLHDSD